MPGPVTRLLAPHRWRHAAAASSAPLPGPAAAGVLMEHGPRPGAQRQRGRCLRHPAARGGPARHCRAPQDPGISTARTGGGKYVPGDIRFQTLHKLSFRPVPDAPAVTPSAPAAPPSALTCFQPCHTSSCGMANGFPSCPDMLTRLLPGALAPVARANRPR